MEKSALALSRPVLKSVPLRFASTNPERLLGKQGNPLIMLRYTLCEVAEESRQELPALNCRNQSNLLNRNLSLLIQGQSIQWLTP